MIVIIIVSGIAEVIDSNPVEASGFFLGFLCNCFSCFTTTRITFTSIPYPHFYNIYISLSSYNGIVEVMGSNPVGASEFFLGFLYDCLSYFTTAKISFTSVLYAQFTHDLYHIHLTPCTKDGNIFQRSSRLRNFSGNLQPLASVRRFQQSTEQEITQPANNEVHKLEYRQRAHPKEQTKVTTEVCCENETYEHKTNRRKKNWVGSSSVMTT